MVKKATAMDVLTGRALFVLTRDPWYKIGWYLRLVPPWHHKRAYLAGLTPAQAAATQALTKASKGAQGS